MSTAPPCIRRSSRPRRIHAPRPEARPQLSRSHPLLHRQRTQRPLGCHRSRRRRQHHHRLALRSLWILHPARRLCPRALLAIPRRRRPLRLDPRSLRRLLRLHRRLDIHDVQPALLSRRPLLRSRLRPLRLRLTRRAPRHRRPLLPHLRARLARLHHAHECRRSERRQMAQQRLHPRQHHPHLAS